MSDRIRTARILVEKFQNEWKEEGTKLLHTGWVEFLIRLCIRAMLRSICWLTGSVKKEPKVNDEIWGTSSHCAVNCCIVCCKRPWRAIAWEWEKSQMDDWFLKVVLIFRSVKTNGLLFRHYNNFVIHFSLMLRSIRLVWRFGIQSNWLCTGRSQRQSALVLTMSIRLVMERLRTKHQA